MQGHFVNDGMVDLANIFNGNTEQLYIDMGHLNKMGYFLVAQRIARDIYESFR